MALHYDFTECPNADAIRESDGGLLQCITFGMMFTGISRLDAKSMPEFKTRLRMWETVHGPISTSGAPIAPALVDMMIGLRTNASPLTIAQFHKQLTTALRERAKRDVRRDERKAEQEGQQ